MNAKNNEHDELDCEVTVLDGAYMTCDNPEEEEPSENKEQEAAGDNI